MSNKGKVKQSGFAMVEIVIFLLVVVAIGAIGYWRLNSSRAEIVDSIDESTEIIEAADELTSSTKTLSTLGYANKTGIIEQFNVLTVSNLDKIGGTAAATRNTPLVTPPINSDYVDSIKMIKNAQAPYLYYFSRYLDPLVIFYQSLRNTSRNSVNIGVLENNLKINYVTNKEQYIKYAVDMADIVIANNHKDTNGDGTEEWLWHPSRDAAGNIKTSIKTCRGKEYVNDKYVVSQLCTLRTTRSLASLAATIKSDPTLNGLYAVNANNYVRFIKNNILKNSYYKTEYDPNATYSHNRAIFLNSQAADTLLNMYIASGKTEAAQSAYLVDAKAIASKLRTATLNATMNNQSPPTGTIYLGINKLCDTLSNNPKYYSLFLNYASQYATDGNGQYNCIAADTSHLNQYVQMVANFRKNGFVFGDDYINKLINTLNDVMWQEWIDSRLPNAKFDKTNRIYPGFIKDIAVKATAPNTIANYLYNSTYDWPKQDVLKGKQIVMSCPVGNNANAKIINVTGNTSSTISLSGMGQFNLQKDTVCHAELYDRAYKDNSGNLTGRIIQSQFSDYSNGMNLTFNNSVSFTPNPKYAPGKQGRNFAEWNQIVSLAPASNPKTALVKAKIQKSFDSMSPDAQTIYLTQSLNW